MNRSSKLRFWPSKWSQLPQRQSSHLITNSPVKPGLLEAAKNGKKRQTEPRDLGSGSATDFLCEPYFKVIKCEDLTESSLVTLWSDNPINNCSPAFWLGIFQFRLLLRVFRTLCEVNRSFFPANTMVLPILEKIYRREVIICHLLIKKNLQYYWYLY